MKPTAGIAIFVTLISAMAYAETYSWVDEKGGLVFSDNPPSAARKKGVRVRKSVSAEKPSAGASEEAVVKKVTPVSRGDVADAVTEDNRDYGGRPLAAWKGEFDTARQEVKRLNGELDIVRDKIAKPQNMSRAEYLAANKKLRELESQAIKVQGGLMKLKKDATAAGVPIMIRGE